MYQSIRIILVLWQALSTVARPNQVSLWLTNLSGKTIDVLWVDPRTNSAVPFSFISVDQKYSLKSFEGHEFEIRERPSEESGVCGSSNDNTCRINRIVVAEAMPEQFFDIDVDLKVDGPKESEEEVLQQFPDMKPDEVVAKCRQNVRNQLAEKRGDSDIDKWLMKELISCMKAPMARALKKKEDDVQFHNLLREQVSTGIENFTCIDVDLASSPDVDQREWTSEKDGVTRKVHVKLDRPASRIHLVKNFAYTEECEAMEEVAAPKLRDAATADGKGGSTISINRKAMQAGIYPKWNKEEEGDLVTRLSRRVYDYANEVLGMNITEHGQEPLMAIQYFGRGLKDAEPDRYTPHCDGKCEGKPHLPGGRMATMVIYCEIPESGGHTNFQNAGVHIKPEVGSGIFFSYIDPETKLMDTGLTQHSGCPVFEGEKKIITQWIRVGVDDEITHNSFNTRKFFESY